MMLNPVYVCVYGYSETSSVFEIEIILRRLISHSFLLYWMKITLSVQSHRTVQYSTVQYSTVTLYIQKSFRGEPENPLFQGVIIFMLHVSRLFTVSTECLHGCGPLQRIYFKGFIGVKDAVTSRLRSRCAEQRSANVDCKNNIIT